MKLVFLGGRDPEKWWCEEHMEEVNEETRSWAEKNRYGGGA